MPLNLNAKTILDKENETNYINQEVQGLHVIVYAVKPVPESAKPCFQVVFKATDNEMLGQIITSRYYTTEKSLWKVRVIACACGMYCVKKDESGQDYKHVNDDFEPKHLLGKELIIDVKEDSYNDKKIFRVDKEREIKLSDVMNKDFSDEVDF